MSEASAAAGELVEIRLDGRPVSARRGQSVAAALAAAGEREFRRTAGGEPRGVFCGMGVCFDCIVTVDGAPNQRACMTIVRPGMAVERGAVAATPRDVAAPSEEREDAPDLLVIGGGPAGLAAAAIAAEAGLDVALVDERPKLGGQYYKQPAAGLAARRSDRQFDDGAALIARVERSGARLDGGVAVWGCAGPREIVAAGAGVSYTFRPRSLIIAAGAYELGVPLPGWTLPGCMTTGAAQTLLRAYGVVPGARVLLSGNGPLNLQVAAELIRAGAEIAALAETAPAPGLARAGALAAMAAAAPDLIRNGAGYRLALRRKRVPVFHGHAVIRVDGDGRAETATIAALDESGRPVADTEKRFAVDAVCFGFGFLPSNEIARALGCRHRYDAERRQLVPLASERGRSTIDGVWIVGDGAGLGGARLALAMGTLAGGDVARTLGRTIGGRHAAELRAAERARDRSIRFQRGLWRLYRAPRLVDQLATPETLVCRCEAVTLAALDAAIAGGDESLGALKRLTRSGMGRCQGRYCARLLAEIVARRSGHELGELSFFAPRIPFKPVPIGQVAAAPAGGDAAGG